MSGTCDRGVSRRRFVEDIVAAAGLGIAGACGAAESPEEPESQPREALNYEQLPGNKVRCSLCPKRCVVVNGGRGFCGVRENRGGRYYTLVYGRPCTVHPDDPIEKKPFFHVYPGTRAFSIATVGCNIKCKFCQNWNISQARPEEVATPCIPPEGIAGAAVRTGARTIAYTYAEPIVFYEYVLDCAKAAQERGIGNVMVSNGSIMPEPLKALLPHLTAVKIDLKAFKESFYENVCEGKLQPVLDTLKLLAESGKWFEIVMLLIPTLNDDPDDIKKMAAWVAKELGTKTPIHFTRFHPQYKMKNIPPTPPETLARARDIAMAEGCSYVYTGNLAGIAGENTYCHSCRTLLVERYGFAILRNRLVDGKCPKCGTVIPGVWA